MPASCWMRTAVTMGDRRELARGPSGMLIASIPASAQRRAFSTIGAHVHAARRRQLDKGHFLAGRQLGPQDRDFSAKGTPSTIAAS